LDDSNQIAIWVTFAGFLLLSWQATRLMREKNYLIFFIWPAFIYLIGPAAMLLFVDQPVLSAYFNENRIAFQTSLMIWYFMSFIAADKVLNISAAMRRALGGRALHRLSSSRIFPALYVATTIAASSLQIYTLKNVGTIFSGIYSLESGEEIPYWGFLAGLYEIIFLCFILVLLGKRPSKRMWLMYIALYSFTTLLRIMGGTRLVLIKEFAFMIIFFYLRGVISGRKLFLVGATVVAIGSGVGLLRSGGGNESVNFLGPVYGLVMESALNALTLGIADTVNQSGIVSRDSSAVSSIAFVLLSCVPSFLRFGIGEADMASLSPYSLAQRAGFDTPSPVGGMSGFATINYLTSYPLPFILAMIVTFSICFKSLRNGPFKQIFALVVMTTAIHFWRDPIDISFKLVAQGLIVCGLLYSIPPRKSKKKEHPNTAGRKSGPLI
jgi:hypothetical protein